MKKTSLRVGLLALILLGAVFGSIEVLQLYSPAHVEAQGFEPFIKTFTLPASASVQYILPCTTGSTNCIPNFKQVAHTVTYKYTTSTNLVSACGILLDGSIDNSTWQTFAANGNAVGAQNGSFNADGYYPFYRIKLTACTYSAVTITYVGYGSTLPVETIPYPAAGNTYSLKAPAIVQRWATPATLTSFQCSNPDPSNAAYLQMFIDVWPATPALGVGSFFTLLIPPKGTVLFAGPPISFYAATHSITKNNLYAGASTAPGGNSSAGVFTATPSFGGINYIQADVGSLLTVTSCAATVAIVEVNSGSGTGPITQIATAPTSPGAGCVTGTALATIGGTGSGATVNIVSLAGGTAVTIPLWCNFQTNGMGPYAPLNPPSP
jgi:hypothetical protein